MRRVLVPVDIAARAPSAMARRGLTLRGTTMGTTWRVDALLPPWVAADALRLAIEAELDAIVRALSTWRADSDLARYGAAPAGTWVDVPQRLWDVVVAAEEVARASSGAFDITVAPLVDLWGFGPVEGSAQRGVRPASDALRNALARSGSARMRLDTGSRRLWQPGGVALDCSGIGKGYAVDRVSAILATHGVDDHLVDIGGELRGEGHKPDGMPWWVAIERPPRVMAAERMPALPQAAAAALAPSQPAPSQPVPSQPVPSQPAPSQPAPSPVLEAADADETLVALHGLSIATSGDYRRRALVDGIECAHTIDPRTGEPVRNGVTSVTVLHASCMQADAWATALLVAGAEEGIRLAQAHDLAALIVTRQGEHLVDFASTRLSALAAG